MSLSYITLADAITYFNTRLHADAWDCATDTDRLKALYTATRAIERLKFIGCKTADDQDLHFPIDGATTVPTEIQYATAELALALLDGADPELEREKLDMQSQGYGQVRSMYDRSNRPPHIMAGIVSFQAWNLLAKYLADPHAIRLNRIS
jgi:hypothetical protein